MFNTNKNQNTHMLNNNENKVVKNRINMIKQHNKNINANVNNKTSNNKYSKNNKIGNINRKNSIVDKINKR